MDHGWAHRVKIMSLRGDILPILLCFLLMACSGVTGGGSGGGNFAAGPVSLSTPATVNKDLVICDNIAGPDVQCRGRVSPFAKVRLSVQAPGFTFQQKLFQNWLLGVAHAAPLTTTVTANSTGVFEALLGAQPEQKIEVRSAASRLVLTVPAEGESVSGVMGLMKNLSVDPNGNVWFSQNQVFVPEKPRRFSWISFFISEAHAQTATFSEEAAVCPGVSFPPRTTPADSKARCEIKRLVPGSETPEVVASFEGCGQDDIRFIRPWEGSDRWVLAGVLDSVYVVDLAATPPRVAKRIRYPGIVLSAAPMAGSLYVTVASGTAGDSSLNLYKVAAADSEIFHSSCVDEEGLKERLAVYAGIQEIVSEDSLGRQFVSVGRFEEGYRVLTGSVTEGENFKIGPKEIFRSPHRLEAAIIQSDFGSGESESSQTYFAILSSEEKKLYVVEDENGTAENSERILVHSFDLGSFIAPYSLAVDRNLVRIAFLDHGPGGARMAVMPIRLSDVVTLDLAAVKFEELGNVVPSALVRLSDEAHAARSETVTLEAVSSATEDSLEAENPALEIQEPVQAYRYVAPPPPPPLLAAPRAEETAPWLVNTQGTELHTFEKTNPGLRQSQPQDEK